MVALYAVQVWPTIAAWFGLPAYESVRQPLPLLMMKHDVRPSSHSSSLQLHAQLLTRMTVAGLHGSHKRFRGSAAAVCELRPSICRLVNCY